ncbi:MAG: response regulator [Polyangia bacterium]
MQPDQHAPVILVVDDNQEIREALSDFLALEGFDVRTAVDGAAALHDLQRNGLPDLVLLDLKMPGMDGYEFLRRRSLDALVQHLPVMVVTANSVERSIPYPVSGVFCKPVDLELLIGAIRREVARSARGPSSGAAPMRH